MKRYIRNTVKKLMNWLLYGYMIEFVEKEMTFRIRFIQDQKTISVANMYTVPQIGSTVEVLINDFPNPEIEKLFLVENVIYSPFGAANKLIGKIID